jgi:putative membrane protein
MDSLLLEASLWGTQWLLKILLNAVALMIGARLLKGVAIEDFIRALVIALLLSVLNATLGNLLDFLTTPLRYLTLGLFSFVVDAALLLLAAHFLKGFAIETFKSAFLLAILLAIFNTILQAIVL